MGERLDLICTLKKKQYSDIYGILSANVDALVSNVLIRLPWWYSMKLLSSYTVVQYYFFDLICGLFLFQCRFLKHFYVIQCWLFSACAKMIFYKLWVSQLNQILSYYLLVSCSDFYCNELRSKVWNEKLKDKDCSTITISMWLKLVKLLFVSQFYLLCFSYFGFTNFFCFVLFHYILILRKKTTTMHYCMRVTFLPSTHSFLVIRIKWFDLRPTANHFSSFHCCFNPESVQGIRGTE